LGLRPLPHDGHHYAASMSGRPVFPQIDTLPGTQVTAALGHRQAEG
jgi:hypothetical protein